MSVSPDNSDDKREKGGDDALPRLSAVRMASIEQIRELQASPRYLKTVEALLEKPAEIGSAGIKAVIETLESKRQINDPFPVVMVHNKSRDFTEYNAELSATAHYRLSVEQPVGDPLMIASVSLRMRGISLPSGNTLGSELATDLMSMRAPFHGQFVKLEKGETLLVSNSVFDKHCVSVSNSSDSIADALWLSSKEVGFSVSEDGGSQPDKEVGSLKGRFYKLKASSENPKGKVKLTNRSGANLEVKNSGNSPIYVILSEPTEVQRPDFQD